MGSFKLKLVLYFSLISLLPFAAAFRGLDAFTERSETRRVDDLLQVELRSALAAYRDELGDAQDSASALARKRSFQRALAARERPALRRALAGAPGLRVEAPGLRLGDARGPAAERAIAVVGRKGRLGAVVASIPLDAKLMGRLRRRAGLEPGDRLAFVSAGRIVASTDGLDGRVNPPPAEPKGVTVAGVRYRALASATLPEPEGVRLAVLAPESRIEATLNSIKWRLFLAMLAALLLIALIAYLEGRSIVRTLGQLVDAARGIARGRLDDRVSVRGRDEFAQLGRAFNEMADQLEERLTELEEERRRLRDATLRFGEALAATLDIDQLLRVIVETAVEATGAAQGVLVQGGKEILSVGDGASATTELELPLSVGRSSFGTLLLRGQNFTSEQRETASWLVGHAVIALENARLHRAVERQALVDGLTGLANRRLSAAALEKELSRAKRFDEPLALVLADLDDFKAVNDRFGHPTGDDVLREFAKTLRESVREIDLAGRWGGEEFALLLPGTDLGGARRLAERIRRALSKRVIPAPDGTRISVTASFGVAAFPDAASEDDLVMAADAALYEAKRKGKNRVAVARMASPVGAPHLQP